MDNFFVLKYSIIGTKTFINNVINSNDTSKQILDPLSCVIRLGLLTFKEKGTKISISNNKIYFQPPNILQGPVRWTCGDGRADLHNLCNPIERSIIWYNSSENKCIENIFKLAIKGLCRLKQSYIIKNTRVGDSNLVCHSISHYINLLQNKLDNKDIDKISDDNGDNSYFRGLWKTEEIVIVDDLFSLAFEKKNKNEEFTYAINAIEAILQQKDQNVANIINKISTSI
jgi:hypothetical protein